MDDDRFKHIKTDPKFRRIPVKERKVKIDNRFQSMFKDKKFKQKYAVDKRGKPVTHTSSEDLKRYYELSSEDEAASEESENDEEEAGKFVRPLKEDKPEAELNKKHSGDKALSDEIKKKLKDLSVDYARGESRLCEESSSDDEESEEEVSDSEGIEHNWGQLDADAEKTEEATYRLAACNMDWDRIRATDLMVLFNSFLNPGAAIKSIAIYPSEFGKERMKEEDIKGPIELVEAKHDSGDEDEEKEEGAKYHMEKLRQYQLNRLKYYYSIITCDSPETAKKIYTECDGMEYESSATKIDLRFVPDDMTFEDEPKEFCEKLPDSSKYQPRFFTTTALQQAKVDLTWDETDPNRIELSQKLANGNVKDLDEEDLKTFVALSSEDEEEETKASNEDSGNEDVDAVEKYKALLQEIEENDSKKKSDMEMEVTWGIDLKAKSEKLVKQKISENECKTPFEQYLEKRKEKRKDKKKKKQLDEDSDDLPSDVDLNDPYFAEEFNKPEFKNKTDKIKKIESNEDESNTAELELLLSNDEDGRKHFNLKKIQEKEQSKKKKRKNKEETNDEDDFEINVEDQRFAAVFNSHHYNIDPTDPRFKKTKAMEKLISEKLKRRNEADEEERSKKIRSEDDISKKSKAELSALAKSVKNKVRNFNKRF